MDLVDSSCSATGIFSIGMISFPPISMCVGNHEYSGDRLARSCPLNMRNATTTHGSTNVINRGWVIPTVVFAISTEAEATGALFMVNASIPQISCACFSMTGNGQSAAEFPVIPKQAHDSCANITEPCNIVLHKSAISRRRGGGHFSERFPGDLSTPKWTCETAGRRSPGKMAHSKAGQVHAICFIREKWNFN